MASLFVTLNALFGFCVKICNLDLTKHKIWIWKQYNLCVTLFTLPKCRIDEIIVQV